MKREYRVETTEDMLGCQTMLEAMGELGRELICTQMSNTKKDGCNIILWIFKRQME